MADHADPRYKAAVRTRLLTPTMKVKRHEVRQQMKGMIADLFA